MQGRLAAAAAAGLRPAWCHEGGALLLRRRGRRMVPAVEPPLCQHTSESEPPDYSAGWVPEKVCSGCVDFLSGPTLVGWEKAPCDYWYWMAPIGSPLMQTGLQSTPASI